MDPVDRELQALVAGARSADADQMTQGARDLARVLGAFRKQLAEDGFRDDEAYELSRDWFGALLYLKDPDEDDED